MKVYAMQCDNHHNAPPFGTVKKPIKSLLLLLRAITSGDHNDPEPKKF